MEAQYKTRDGRFVFKVEGGTQKELFRQLSLTQEVFEAETECGCCRSKQIRFRVRSVDGNEYYELVCDACSAKFDFGQRRDGSGLFPKRKDATGLLPDRGWAKFQKKEEGEHSR